jgi:hypothetical protein
MKISRLNVWGAKEDRRPLSSIPEIENMLSHGTEDALDVR